MARVMITILCVQTRQQSFFFTPPVFSTRAPDGSCILTNSADNVLRLYNLPPQIYSYNWDSLPEMVDTCAVIASVTKTDNWGM